MPVTFKVIDEAKTIEEAKLAKESEDIALSIMKDDKGKGRVNDKGKGKIDDKGKGKMDDKGKGKVDVDKGKGKVDADKGKRKMDDQGKGKTKLMVFEKTKEAKQTQLKVKEAKEAELKVKKGTTIGKCLGGSGMFMEEEEIVKLVEEEEMADLKLHVCGNVIDQEDLYKFDKEELDLFFEEEARESRAHEEWLEKCRKQEEEDEEHERQILSYHGTI
ncbi:hypothetical protein Tco_0739135 [Tanacetum coccineum]